MKTIRFDKNHTEIRIVLKYCPEIVIKSFNVVSQNPENIMQGNLIVSIICLNDKQEERKSFKELIGLTDYDNINRLKGREICVNRIIKFQDCFKFTKDDECSQWRICFKVENVDFKHNDSLIVKYDFLKI